MDRRSRWQRLDAEHWIHVTGMLLTTVLVLWTFWVTLAGLVGGLLGVALFPGALAALAGWLTSAWRRERAWSWWAWTVLAALGVLAGLAGLADVRPGGLVWLIAHGGLLLLLCHPDSRARTRVPPTSGTGPGRGTTRA